MKRKTALVCMIELLVILVSACEASGITGKWELTAYRIRETGEIVQRDNLGTSDTEIKLAAMGKSTMTIGSNGKLQIEFPEADINIGGTYTVDGSVIHIYNEGEDTPSLGMELVGDTIEFPALYQATFIYTKK